MYEMSREFLGCHVAGFAHWYGLEVVDELRPGRKLRLAGEPDNPYDANAVVVYCDDVKIGYVPARHNAAIAKLVYFGYGDMFEARVQSVDWTEHPERQVHMTIFIKDAR